MHQAGRNRELCDAHDASELYTAEYPQLLFPQSALSPSRWPAQSKKRCGPIQTNRSPTLAFEGRILGNVRIVQLLPLVHSRRVVSCYIRICWNCPHIGQIRFKLDLNLLLRYPVHMIYYTLPQYISMNCWPCVQQWCTSNPGKFQNHIPFLQLPPGNVSY